MKPPIYHRIANYRKTLLPNNFLAELETNCQGDKDWKASTGKSIGYPGWGVLYYTVLSLLDPDKFNTIIETGTNWGSTTIVLAQALKDSGRSGQVHTIELDPENYAKAQERLSLAGVDDFVTCHCGDSLKVLPALLKDVEDVRFAFLDASHLLEDVLGEFSLLHPKLDTTSVVAFDNTYKITEQGDPARVFEALHEIQRRYGGNLINFPFVSWYTPGLALWQQRPFDHRCGLAGAVVYRGECGPG